MQGRVTEQQSQLQNLERKVLLSALWLSARHCMP